LDKIKVIMPVASWPEALELQRLALTKYLKEPFDLIGVIDTDETPGPYNLWDSSLRKKAINIAENTCERVVLVPEEFHKDRSKIFAKTKELSGNIANLRAAVTLQHAFNTEVLNDSNKILILDNDMFPITYFSWEEKMKMNFCRSVVYESRSKLRKKSISHLWGGLMFIDAVKIPFKQIWSFDCGKINGVKVDVSGNTYHWLNKVKEQGLESKFQTIKHLPSLQWNYSDLTNIFSGDIKKFIVEDERNIDNNYYTEFYDETFLHFRAGSNWKKEPARVVKSRIDKFSDCLRSHVDGQ
jgi:hypothetical protein